MKIIVNNERDFVTVLEDHLSEGGHVFDNVVRRNRDDRWLSDTKTLREVTLHLSAVLDYEDGSQAILECGMDCGTDLLTGDGHTDGSDAAEKAVGHVEREIARLQSAIHSLRLQPGVIRQ